jgi:predicted proteasome-type protease
LLQIGHSHRFDERDPYMLNLRQTWGEGVRRAFAQLPRLEW